MTRAPMVRLGKSGVGIYVHGRCPSWSPGNELKCILEKGHDGECIAKRRGPMAPGEPIHWIPIARP